MSRFLPGFALIAMSDALQYDQTAEATLVEQLASAQREHNTSLTAATDSLSTQHIEQLQSLAAEQESTSASSRSAHLAELEAQSTASMTNASVVEAGHVASLAALAEELKLVREVGAVLYFSR